MANVSGSQDKYVALFNISDSQLMPVSVTFAELGIKGKYKVKDLWTGKDKPLDNGKQTVALEPHASMLVKFSKGK